MNKFIQSEKNKRDKAKALNQAAQEQWKIQKNDIEKTLRSVFEGFLIDGKEFHIDTDLNDELSSKKYIGYDCIQVTHPTRLTGNMVITKGEESTNYDRKMEVGAALSITCSKIGNFDAFLIPSKNDDRLIEIKSILIYSTKDPHKLTRKRIESFVKKYLIFQRVDSLFEYSSLLDKLYIKWLYFVDVRNRDKRSSLLFQVTNHWGAVALSALAAWVIAKNT